MSAGSVRKANLYGVPWNVAADASISLNPRIEKEPIPHTGGNMIKRTTVGAMAEAIKLIVTPSEYDILEGLVASTGSDSQSYDMADGSSLKTVGEVNLGPYVTEDSSCEVQVLTSTGVWEIFSAS